MDWQYFPQSRAEFLIATGRLVLASFSLLAIWLDPSTPTRFSDIAYGLLAAYVIYSLGLALVAWHMKAPSKRLGLVTHVFDLLIFTAFIVFTEGSTSPFFVYFIFSLVCAALRWQWHGAMWTGAISLAAFAGMGVYMGTIANDPSFELNRFIIRSVYLAVAGVLLGYMGAYEQRRCTDLSTLAAWSVSLPPDISVLVTELLSNASRILKVPRAIMVWEEPEEPWLYLASWSDGKCSVSRESPDVFGSLVTEPLMEMDFLCSDAEQAAPTVLYSSGSLFRYFQGAPISTQFQTRFKVCSVLSLNLSGKNLWGRLFLLDGRRMTSDELTLGRIVADRISTGMEQYYLMQALQQVKASEERIRLARDLHDGLLQSLAGVALKMELLHRIMDDSIEEAHRGLHEVQGLLISEQRDLRCLIEELKPLGHGISGLAVSLDRRIEELARYVGRHWALNVEIEPGYLGQKIADIPAQEVYFIVREALVNAAKHSMASHIHVSLSPSDHWLHIVIKDNGSGFPFHGHYDDVELSTLGLGPSTIKERVAMLEGKLSIDSRKSGARLMISLPLGRSGG